MAASNLFNFAMITLFAREFLEGSIIIGEYRTVILRSNVDHLLANGVTKDDALNAITIATLGAIAFALFVIACVAIPLAILSSTFDANTGYIIEGVSKIVAAISLLQLSLKIPKLFGIYLSSKTNSKNKSSSHSNLFTTTARVDSDTDNNSSDKDNTTDPSITIATLPNTPNTSTSTIPGTTDTRPHHHPYSSLVLQTQSSNAASASSTPPGLTLRSIRFNVAWNIWREVAEIGAFLLPSFLSNSNLQAIPLSGLIGAIVGTMFGIGIFIANQRFKKRNHLCIFVVLLLVILSAGLYTGGSHKLEIVIGTTQTIWTLTDDFWSVDRLPMTIIKPFGYSDTRTLLEIISFWSWLLLSALLHYRKYRISPKADTAVVTAAAILPTLPSSDSEESYEDDIDNDVEKCRHRISKDDILTVDETTLQSNDNITTGTTVSTSMTDSVSKHYV